MGLLDDLLKQLYGPTQDFQAAPPSFTELLLRAMGKTMPPPGRLPPTFMGGLSRVGGTLGGLIGEEMGTRRQDPLARILPMAESALGALKDVRLPSGPPITPEIPALPTISPAGSPARLGPRPPSLSLFGPVKSAEDITEGPIPPSLMGQPLLEPPPTAPAPFDLFGGQQRPSISGLPTGPTPMREPESFQEAFMNVPRAAQRGLMAAKAAGLDLSPWYPKPPEFLKAGEGETIFKMKPGQEPEVVLKGAPRVDPSWAKLPANIAAILLSQSGTDLTKPPDPEKVAKAIEVAKKETPPKVSFFNDQNGNHIAVAVDSEGQVIFRKNIGKTPRSMSEFNRQIALRSQGQDVEDPAIQKLTKEQAREIMRSMSLAERLLGGALTPPTLPRTPDEEAGGYLGR